MIPENSVPVLLLAIRNTGEPGSQCLFHATGGALRSAPKMVREERRQTFGDAIRWRSADPSPNVGIAEDASPSCKIWHGGDSCHVNEES